MARTSAPKVEPDATASEAPPFSPARAACDREAASRRAFATAGCPGSSARQMLSCDIIQWLTFETCEMMLRKPVILRASIVSLSMCVRFPKSSVPRSQL
jgi:hypothetical protein